MFWRAFLTLNGFWLGSSFMQPNRRLTVCIRRSTSPMGQWSLAGAYINSMLYLLHSCCILLPFKHLAWSSRIFLGTPCWVANFFKNFSIFGPFSFETNFSVGNFRNGQCKPRSKLPSLAHQILVRRNPIEFFFGSEHGGRGVQSDFCINFFRFLPNSVQVDTFWI